MRAVTILVCASLLMPVLLACGLGLTDISERGLTSRLPIRINGNADFIAANGVTGGSGNESDPWQIDSWDITGAGFAYGIYIGNTTERFVVRNCSVQNSGGTFVSYYYTESGIILYNVSGGGLLNNTVRSNEFDGICLYNSTECSVAGNNVTGNEYGITVMDGSANNSISGNSVSANAYYGIDLIQSDDNIVLGNNVSDNGGNGICISECGGNNLVNNRVWGNENGIDVWDSGNNTVSGNWLCNNYNGIYLEYTLECTLANNNVSDNGNFGIQMATSSGNTAYHNRIWNNTYAQAGDSTGGNAWDAGYPSGGNSWSDSPGSDSDGDGIGDAPYTGILGDMGARDRYPLMQPWFPDAMAPQASAGEDIVSDEDAAVPLNSTGSSDNVGIVNYTWSFNNSVEEVSIYQRSPSYSFTQPGIYSVMLHVADSAGNSDWDEVIVSVIDITPPNADAGPNWDVGEGALIIFNGSASTDNVGVADLVWSINDGTDNIVLHGVSVSHIFAMAGSYTAVLNVTDAKGLWATDSALVTVSPDSTPPVANAGTNFKATIGEAVRFNGSGSGDNVAIDNYTWGFSHNGSVQNLYGCEPRYTFWAAGNYTVRLSVRDLAGNTANDSVMVTITETAADPAETNETEETGPENVTESSAAIAAAALLCLASVFTAFIIKKRRHR